MCALYIYTYVCVLCICYIYMYICIYVYMYICIVIGVSTGSSKLKNTSDLTRAICFPKLHRPNDLISPAAAPRQRSKDHQMDQGRPRHGNDWPQSKWLQAVIHTSPTSGLPQPNRLQNISPSWRDLHGIVDKDWDTLWIHTPKRSFKTLSVIFFGVFCARL